MKTTIITIATIVSLALGTTKAATVNVADDSAATVLTDVNHINKIEVRGNVELYVSDGSADQVKVYNRYYAENALVQNQKGVLRIASYNAKKLVVWVKASDLRSIEVFDNATVKSFGTLAPIALDVQLHNAASAKLDLASYSANITVDGNAKADLSGNVKEYAIKYGQSTSVNYANLTGGKSHIVKTGAPYMVNSNELAVL